MWTALIVLTDENLTCYGFAFVCIVYVITVVVTIMSPYAHSFNYVLVMFMRARYREIVGTRIGPA